MVGKKRKIKQALNRLATDPDFKEVLAWLAAESGITRPRFSKDPMEMAFNEGQRHLVSSILVLMAKYDTDFIVNETDKALHNEH